MNQTFEFKIFIDTPEKLTQQEIANLIMDAIPGKNTHAVVAPVNEGNIEPRDLFRRLFPNEQFNVVQEALFCLGYSHGYTNGALDQITTNFTNPGTGKSWKPAPKPGTDETPQP